MGSFTLQKLISFVLLVLFTVFHSSLNVASDPEADALLNWLNPWPLLPTNVTTPCTWVGISCNLAGSVIQISLTNLGVQGTLQNFSFSSFPNLVYVDLSKNNLSGSIPSQISQLSKLMYLDLSFNKFSGIIPPEIGLLSNLGTLHLFENLLSGYLPQNICQSQPLRNFTIYNNHLEGPIPKSLRDCTSFIGASFEGNRFIGNISEAFGVYPNLEYMDLSHNQFYGEISSNWGISSSLGTLKIAGNNISGRIPPNIGDAAQLHVLDLSLNQLVGQIPKELAKLTRLSMLDLSWNSLSGEIPSQLSSLQRLEILNLSHNSLFGSIHDSFAKMRGLLAIDLSYNQLEGPIPNSKAFQNASIGKLQGNKGLCGDVQGLQPCKGSSKKRHINLVLIIFLPLLGASLLLSFFVVLYFSYKRKRDPEAGDMPDAFETTSASCHDDHQSRKELDESRTSQYLPFFDISIILAATENFSNKIGQGGFGLVYKGQLANGQEIAVKRLSKNSRQGIQEFKNEVRLISKLQHRNLVKLIGCCINEEEKMLIYEYLPNKSLDFFIFEETRQLLLDWRKRSEIIFGIARGVLYLHQDSRLKIIHRDLKASNILLDAAMNPKISDFGMAKLFEDEQVEANTKRVAGTYGYISPEYAMDGLYSIKSDVFSFGVLILEIICGKKNTDYHENMPAVNLIGHVWNLWREAKAMDIVDPLLKQSYSQEILRCIQIGLLCVQESPVDRPTMLEVLFMLGNEMSIPSPKKPAFLLQEHNGRNLDLLAAKVEVYSVNNVTVSDIEAR